MKNYQYDWEKASFPTRDSLQPEIDRVIEELEADEGRRVQGFVLDDKDGLWIMTVVLED